MKTPLPSDFAVSYNVVAAQNYRWGAPWTDFQGVQDCRTRVTVTLKKKGDLLQVFVGQTKVAEYEKGIPPGVQFDAMSFDLQGNTADERMFIGNIRIANN